MKQKQTKNQNKIVQQVNESKRSVDFATLYKSALKVMNARKQVIDGLKDK